MKTKYEKRTELFVKATISWSFQPSRKLFRFYQISFHSDVTKSRRPWKWFDFAILLTIWGFEIWDNFFMYSSRRSFIELDNPCIMKMRSLACVALLLLHFERTLHGAHASNPLHSLRRSMYVHTYVYSALYKLAIVSVYRLPTSVYAHPFVFNQYVYNAFLVKVK